MAIGAPITDPVGKMISESTSIDLQILLAMQSTLNRGSTLLDFLASQSQQAIWQHSNSYPTLLEVSEFLTHYHR